MRSKEEIAAISNEIAKNVHSRLKAEEHARNVIRLSKKYWSPIDVSANAILAIDLVTNRKYFAMANAILKAHETIYRYCNNLEKQVTEAKDPVLEDLYRILGI